MPAMLKGYDELIREFPLRPIRSDRQLARATAVANRLAVQSRLTAGENDYLEVLAGLIEQYESELHPILEQTGPDLLSFLMSENGLQSRNLATATGVQASAISGFIEKTRDLTLEQLRAIGRHFKVSPALFVSDA